MCNLFFFVIIPLVHLFVGMLRVLWSPLSYTIKPPISRWMWDVTKEGLFDQSVDGALSSNRIWIFKLFQTLVHDVCSPASWLQFSMHLATVTLIISRRTQLELGIKLFRIGLNLIVISFNYLRRSLTKLPKARITVHWIQSPFLAKRDNHKNG